MIDHRRREKGERFFEIAEQEVDGAGRDQQEQHRLANDVDGDVEQSARTCGGKLVGTIGRQPGRGLCAGQPRRGSSRIRAR